jgi:hypothetical protein
MATRTPDLYRVKEGAEGAERELSFVFYHLRQLPASVESNWSPNSPPWPDAPGLRGLHDQPVQGAQAHCLGGWEDWDDIQARWCPWLSLL